MSAFEALLAYLGIKIQVLLASTFGGILSMHFWRIQDAQGAAASLGQRVFVVTTGAGLGVYIGPYSAEFLNSSNKERAEVAFGLIVAVVGMAVLANVVKAVRELDLKAIITKRLGGGEPKGGDQ